MTYRCLTCGFAQDFDPTDTAKNERVHPWMKGKEAGECPACHEYLQRFGGRKNGKLEMPDIKTPGILEDERNEEVATRIAEMTRDFETLKNPDLDDETKYVMNNKYNKLNLLFGWTAEDLMRLSFRKKQKE